MGHRRIPGKVVSRLLLVAIGIAPLAHADAPPPGQAPPPMRVVLPVSAGSGIDAVMRTVQAALSRALGGQPVVVENLPGAGGLIGMRTVVNAAPDGRTIGLLSNNIALPRDPAVALPREGPGDVTPICMVATSPFVLVVNAAKVRATNARELQAHLNAAPGASNYGSSGSGTITHLAAKLFLSAARATAQQVPYTATSGMLADLVGGRIDMAVFAVATVRGHIDSGVLRPIGVMSRQRVPALPQVPTFAEQGFPEIELTGWVIAAGPPKLPEADVARIHEAFVVASKDVEVRASLARHGYTVETLSPEATARFVEAERTRYARLAATLELKRE
jgi:tripartite-type tricarboxylate transporter receptor subunit TctC